MIARRDLLAGSAAALALSPVPVFAAATTLVTTGAGRVRGTVEGGVHVFRGLRYGEDTRPLRFRAPLPARPSAGIVEAMAFAPSCPQRGGASLPHSEDCLFLNIWTPAPDPRARRPVMLYIHGGAYSSGSAVDPLLVGSPGTELEFAL